jgi:hypothetical protein
MKLTFDTRFRYVLDNPIKAGLKNWKWVGLTERGARILGQKRSKRVRQRHAYETGKKSRAGRPVPLTLNSGIMAL